MGDHVLATVQFDFEGTEESELTLQKGEVLKVIAKYDNGWWVGENSAGITGVFPGSYVKEEPSPLGQAPPPPPPVVSLPVQQPQPVVGTPPPVEVSAPLPAAVPVVSTPAAVSTPHLAATSPAAAAIGGVYVTAKRDFNPTHPMQLAFKSGDQILLLE